MIESILVNLGLSKNETKVYLYLLKYRISSAYEISKEISINRALIYDVLEQLLHKGLINQINKDSKKYFQASDPSFLKELVEVKKRKINKLDCELKKALPDLIRMKSFLKEKVSVEVFKEKNGLKYLLKDIIKTKQNVMITGIEEERYQEEIPEFILQYFRDLKLNQIKEKVITSKKNSGHIFDNKTAHTTEYRFLDVNYFNATNTFIYGTKVAIVIWQKPLTIVLINNEKTAKTYKIHFDYLWHLASK